MKNIEDALDKLIEKIKLSEEITCEEEILIEFIPIIKRLTRLPKIKSSSIALEFVISKINSIAHEKKVKVPWMIFKVSFAFFVLFIIYSFTILQNPGIKEKVKYHLTNDPKYKVNYHIITANTQIKKFHTTITKLNKKVIKKTIPSINEHVETAFEHVCDLSEKGVPVEILDNLEQLYSTNKIVLGNMRKILPEEYHSYIDENIKLCDERIKCISELKGE